MNIATPPTNNSFVWKLNIAGCIWLLLATVAAGLFFAEGLDALVEAWATPEYSHGPLIPVLSGLLFLRQLKEEPVTFGPVMRWPGVVILVVAVGFGLLGKLSHINDVVAYATILWVGGLLLISFGWSQGKHFWPGVLHLIYMLPLPGLFYYKLSTFLQGVSSELGVSFLALLHVPVFLDGNIIDLGVLKLHVAEACSGLRYLFPIMSFSYVFAVLYRGPTWHKVILLLAAAPITVFMNSVRIALAGLIVQRWGVGHLEGFSHFFEGWVIFMASVLLLFLLAWIMLRLQRSNISLPEALDLETDGLWPQFKRLGLVQPSKALIGSAILMIALASAWQIRPVTEHAEVDREPFALYPLSFGEWKSRPTARLSQVIEDVLGADDYYGASFAHPSHPAAVDFFSAYYEDQTKGGIHSPEVCLPGGGWEISALERVDVAPELDFADPFELNRAVIQKGEARMLVYYWFEQHGRHVAWDFEAKILLLWDGLRVGRTDGALVRLTTPILQGESLDEAEVRLREMFLETTKALPRFIPPVDG